MRQKILLSLSIVVLAAVLALPMVEKASAAVGPGNDANVAAAQAASDTATKEALARDAEAKAATERATIAKAESDQAANDAVIKDADAKEARSKAIAAEALVASLLQFGPSPNLTAASIAAQEADSIATMKEAVARDADSKALAAKAQSDAATNEANKKQALARDADARAAAAKEHLIKAERSANEVVNVPAATPTPTTCVGAACNHKDPASMRCNLSQMTFTSFTLKDSSQTTIATGNIVHSIVCNANWVEGTLSTNSQQAYIGKNIYISISTTDSTGSTQFTCSPSIDNGRTCDTGGYNGATGWPEFSDMVDGTHSSYATLSAIGSDGKLYQASTNSLP